VSRRETLIAKNQIWRAWCWREVKKGEVVRVMALVCDCICQLSLSLHGGGREGEGQRGAITHNTKHFHKEVEGQEGVL